MPLQTHALVDASPLPPNPVSPLAPFLCRPAPSKSPPSATWPSERFRSPHPDHRYRCCVLGLHPAPRASTVGPNASPSCLPLFQAEGPPLYPEAHDLLPHSSLTPFSPLWHFSPLRQLATKHPECSFLASQSPANAHRKSTTLRPFLLCTHRRR